MQAFFFLIHRETNPPLPLHNKQIFTNLIPQHRRRGKIPVSFLIPNQYLIGGKICDSPFLDIIHQFLFFSLTDVVYYCVNFKWEEYSESGNRTPGRATCEES